MPEKILVSLIEHRVHGVHIVVDAQTFGREGGAKFRHIIDRPGQQPDHGRVQLLPLQLRDVQIHHGRIGADHLVDKMLIELSAFPVFQIDQSECHNITSKLDGIIIA